MDTLNGIKIKINMLIPIYYNRERVENDKDNIYLFSDNLTRTSGRNKISHTSWYVNDFGYNCRYPNVTNACIRGLDNAYPITTMLRYIPQFDYKQNRWTDDLIDMFKKVIDNDFDRIKKIVDLKHISKVYIPKNGFFNSKISNITEQRCPLIYHYLKDKLVELSEYLSSIEDKLWN